MIASETFFGVETEMGLPVDLRDCFDVGQYHHGKQIPNAPRGWTLETDGSLSMPSSHFPVEMVSPKLKGEKGLADMVFMLDEMKRIGGKVNHTTGTHIHIDASSFDRPMIMNLLHLWKTVEKDMYRLNGTDADHRFNHYFCQPVDWRLGEKYRSLNVSNWLSGAKPTVEFRLFQSSLDAEKVVGYVYLCMSIVVLSTRITAPQHAENTQTVQKIVQLFRDRNTYRIVQDGDVLDILCVAFRNIRRSGI